MYTLFVTRERSSKLKPGVTTIEFILIIEVVDLFIGPTVPADEGVWILY